MATDYERVLFVKPEVFIYKIPPRSTSRGYRAADWKLENPDWIGRMKIMSKGKECYIRIEDKNTGELFAKAPVPTYPGEAVESVLDSSRYFVLRIEDDSGRKAFIGLGFTDRGDSFDFNVTLQDHFKREKLNENLEEEAKKLAENPGPKLDLGFKEGQTITINLGKKDGASRPRSRPTGGAGGPVPLLPPPGTKAPILSPPPSTAPTQNINVQQQPGSADFLGLGFQNNSTQPQQLGSSQEWGDFASSTSNQSQQSQGSNWVQF